MLTKLMLLLLRVYKLGISPYLSSQCIYLPSCSEYAAEAVQHHGAARGMWLTGKRLGRCHPFNRGGFDPVPDAKDR